MSITYLNILPDQIPPTSGSWDDLSEWGISVATTYNVARNEWIHWSEEAAEQCLISHLRAQDLVVTYNYNGFDKMILSAFGKVDRIPAFSLMDRIQEDVGVRLRLQNVGRANGLEAIRIGIPDFLRANPDRDQRIGYNVNKINVMNALVQRAIMNGTLWYYGTGEDRSPRRFNTMKWKDILNGSRMTF